MPGPTGEQEKDRGKIEPNQGEKLADVAGPSVAATINNLGPRDLIAEIMKRKDLLTAKERAALNKDLENLRKNFEFLRETIDEIFKDKGPKDTIAGMSVKTLKQLVGDTIAEEKKRRELETFLQKGHKARVIETVANAIPDASNDPQRLIRLAKTLAGETTISREIREELGVALSDIKEILIRLRSTLEKLYAREAALNKLDITVDSSDSATPLHIATLSRSPNVEVFERSIRSSALDTATNQAAGPREDNERRISELRSKLDDVRQKISSAFNWVLLGTKEQHQEALRVMPLLDNEMNKLQYELHQRESSSIGLNTAGARLAA